MTTTTGTDNGAKLRLIQALLAKAADDAATPAESETYVAKATELMAKYGIEQAHLNAAKPAGQRETVTSMSFDVEAPYALDKASLLHTIGEALGCKTIRLLGRGKKNGWQVVRVFGFPSDLAQVEMLFASLTLQVTRDMLRADAPYYENVAAFRRTFIAGFTSVVRRRLVEMYAKTAREAEVSTPGTALVLVDRKDEISHAYAEAYPRVRSGRNRQLSGSGKQAGRESGRRADIGGRGVGGSAQQRLGR